MLTGYYAAISGTHYNSQKLSVVSNNLANAQTPGFKRSLLMVRSREENPATQWMDSAVKQRHLNSYGVQHSGVYKVYKKGGALRQTGNSLDVALPPELSNAFFSVQRVDPNDTNSYYTRNGSLSLGPLNPEDPTSPTVLYLSGHIALDQNKQPISIDPLEGELDIGPDGMLYQGENEVGQLAVYRMNKTDNPNNLENANLQLLEQKGESLFAIPKQAKEEIHPISIQVGENGVKRLVKQGVKEGSNVSIFQEMVEMMNATKGARANKSSIKAQTDSLTKLFQMVRQ